MTRNSFGEANDERGLNASAPRLQKPCTVCVFKRGCSTNPVTSVSGGFGADFTLGSYLATY